MAKLVSLPPSDVLCTPPAAVISTVSMFCQLKNSLVDPDVLTVNVCVWGVYQRAQQVLPIVIWISPIHRNVVMPN
jgi:hypothetical protein